MAKYKTYYVVKNNNNDRKIHVIKTRNLSFSKSTTELRSAKKLREVRETETFEPADF